jgi:hypothetical protein
MVQLFGEYIENENDLEFLVLNFSPTSIPIQQRWRNNGLSAEFLGSYWATFFPNDERLSPNRQEEVSSAVSYIANELLENAMKFNYAPSQCVISIALHLHPDHLLFYVRNCIDPASVDSFQAFIQELLSCDPDEMYMQQLEKAAEDETEESHLGLLTMMNDYQATIGFKFEPSRTKEHGMSVTTMVQLPVAY